MFLRQCSRCDVIPMQWGGLPLMPGRAVPFQRRKGTKRRHGAAPPGTPGRAIRRICCFQNLPFLTFTEVPLLARRLCANPTKPNQARLLPFGLCCSAVGAGLTRPPLSMKLACRGAPVWAPVSPCRTFSGYTRPWRPPWNRRYLLFFYHYFLKSLLYGSSTYA